MQLERIQDILLCPNHNKKIIVDNNVIRTSCCKKIFQVENEQIIILGDNLSSIPEVEARNIQAQGYLRHDKFPTQLSRINNWLKKSYISKNRNCLHQPTAQKLLGFWERQNSIVKKYFVFVLNFHTDLESFQKI